MKPSKFPAFVLIMIASLHLQGCGSHSKEANPGHQGAEQVRYEGCNVYSFPESTLTKLKPGSFNKEIYDAFQNQLHRAESELSPFGEGFKEYSPDPSAGYAEGYFAINVDPRMDRINRKFVHVAGYDQGYLDFFQNLYVSGTERNWNPNKIKRGSGVVFGGYKMSVEEIKKNCGIWSNLLKTSPNHPKKRVFQELIENDQKIPSFAFDLSSHVGATTHSVFLSATRSVHVARVFALNTGHQGNSVDAGYVYVFLVHKGFDASRKGTNDLRHYEQEVSISGSIPWSDVIGYRKIVRSQEPGRSTPPEFVGPIFLRENFETREPEAAKNIIHQLSIKSRFTKLYEKGKDWIQKANQMSTDDEYWSDFRKKYPWDKDPGF